MAATDPSPSRSGLRSLDAVNLFLAGALSGFGPYIAVFLAEQKWTQQNIGFVLTAGGLGGLLSQLPSGELLDAIRSKRVVVASGAIMVATSALIIALWPSFPPVLAALVLQSITGGFLGLAMLPSASAWSGTPHLRSDSDAISASPRWEA
jgi:predicted MFS family arabinose efflux permease